MVNPDNLDLKPSENKVTGVFVVINDGKRDLPINVKILSRVIDENGKETRGEIDAKELMVFPSAAKVKANSTTAFRVFYSGKGKINLEKNYRIIFTEEKPTKIDEKTDGTTAKIRFNTAYANNINILPASGKRDPIKIDGITEKDGKKILTLTNDSNYRYSLKNQDLVIKDKKGKVHKVKSTSLEELQNPIQAKTKRKVKLPLFNDLDPKSIGVELEEIQ